jgi:hypothetical protein
MYQLNDEDFYKYLAYFNELTNDFSQWKEIKARKEHIDEYGDLIKKNDFYFSR